MEILTGLRKGISGQVEILGEDLFGSTPRKFFEKGVTSIPEDRQKHGLVLDFTVAENLILQNFGKEPYSKKGILKKDLIRKHATKLIEKFDIRPSGCENRLAGELSGGNQQKIVLGKWLAIKPDVLILDEPTRGVDVNAKFEIYSVINELAKAGIAVIMVSSELPEIINMCDNVCVIKAGKMTGMLGREELDQERIMQYAAGGEE